MVVVDNYKLQWEGEIINKKLNEHVNYFNVLNQPGPQQVKAVTYELIVFGEIITKQKKKKNQHQHKH